MRLMLCELAHSFPPRVAELLERDRNLTRNFREETVTDLLMASLVGLDPFGIRVDFPDEPTTGGDMEWIFAAPLEVKGGRYLRVLLQAKRAQYAKLKTGGYWYYQHLDHGDPKGSQAQTLVSHSGATPAGIATLPIYIVYHPTAAISPRVPATAKTPAIPAIEGINLIFATLVAPVVKGGCSKHEKRVDRWRNHFMPLSDLLCWPMVVTAPPPPPGPGITQFVVNRTEAGMVLLSGGFHPDIVARRFGERLGRARQAAAVDGADFDPVRPVDGIPGHIRRAIDGKMTIEDRQTLKRPRVILSTRLSRDSEDFGAAEILSR
jgi:hypothetical protein